jgi:hypothetical protein
MVDVRCCRSVCSENPVNMNVKGRRDAVQDLVLIAGEVHEELVMPFLWRSSTISFIGICHVLKGRECCFPVFMALLRQCPFIIDAKRSLQWCRMPIRPRNEQPLTTFSDWT